MKHSRSKMYSRRAQHKRTKTVTKAEKKAANAVTTKEVGGAKNGGSRKVRHDIDYESLSMKHMKICTNLTAYTQGRPWLNHALIF